MAYFNVFFTAFCCFIFYIQADAACPSGWTSSGSGTCLRYYNNRKTYNRASGACKQLGAELVTLETTNKIIFFRGYRSIIGFDVKWPERGGCAEGPADFDNSRQNITHSGRFQSSFEGRLDDTFWIGAHKYYGYWKWDGLYTGRMTVTDWNSGEPNNNRGDEDCVEAHHLGGWNDGRCHGYHDYVCEKYE